MKRSPFFLVLLLLFVLNSCGMKQQYELYQAVEKGTRLDEVHEIDLAAFLSKWITKRTDERGVSIYEIYSNSAFVFFSFRGDSIYKIKQDLLSTLDYKAIDGPVIRNQFFDEMVPESDRINCEGSGSYNPKFTYSVDLEKKEITIILHNVIRCEFIKKLDKTYKAVYSYETKKMTPIP